MTALNLSLHPSQSVVFHNDKRFKVVAAGRRWGKTRLAITKLAVWAMSGRYAKRDFFYVAPTYQQAKDIVWQEAKELLAPIIASTHENTGVITLINGKRISLKGSDRPDTLRGIGLGGVVVDEYADMKPFVWEEILSPSLAEVQAPALFIGTPKGRNHFYALTMFAQEEESADEWGFWHFTTYDNPYIPRVEIESARKRMSTFAFDQEFMASFKAASSGIFKPAWFKESAVEPDDGQYVVAADLAGFTEEHAQRSARSKFLDNSAITKAKIHEDGWWIQGQDVGRWPVRETALRLVKACKEVDSLVLGIERGIAQQAVMPYLRECMIQEGYYFRIELLTHGNRQKTNRITWALQGRLEHGRITFNPGKYLDELLDEALQFPDDKTKDDRIDSLAYVDQLATVALPSDEQDEFNYNPYDPLVGF